MAKLDKLITYAYLKEEVDIPQNIDNEEFDHKIYQAQETLRMVMGDEFYQDYIVKYRTPLTGSYLSLYSYIKQYVAWQTYEFWVVTANFKPTRSGFRVHTEDNSSAASDIQMSILIKNAKQSAQYYKKLLVDYMNGNRTLFPLYGQSCGQNVTGNTFHISVVRRRKHDHNCRCRSCRW